MLDKLRLIFSKSEPETSASLLAARGELEAARAEAIEALRKAQVEKNSLLIEAVASGDTKTRASLRKQLAEMQGGVDELGAALAGLDARIERARAAEAEQAADDERAERARLASEREQAAVDLQRSIEALADAFTRFDRLSRKVEGITTRRTIEHRGILDFDLVVAVSEQLQCRTAGRLGDPRVLRTYTLGEFVRAGLLIDLQKHASNQHERLGLSAPDLPRAA